MRQGALNCCYDSVGNFITAARDWGAVVSGHQLDGHGSTRVVTDRQGSSRSDNGSSWSDNGRRGQTMVVVVRHGSSWLVFDRRDR